MFQAGLKLNLVSILVLRSCKFILKLDQSQIRLQGQVYVELRTPIVAIMFHMKLFTTLSH